MRDAVLCIYNLENLSQLIISSYQSVIEMIFQIVSQRMCLRSSAAKSGRSEYLSKYHARQRSRNVWPNTRDYEIIHRYYDQWPTGIAVAADGIMFSNYPPGQDLNNSAYTIAELNSNNTETPYPNAEINSPPGGSINYTTVLPIGAHYQDCLIGVQTVTIDPANRLWILDTGRAATPDGTMVPASYGAPKLIGVNLSNNSIFTTIVFSPTAAPADSYLNDVRFDLNPDLTPSGQGIAYITDSSMEGGNALVIVDIGAKTAWRPLINNLPYLPHRDLSQPFGERLFTRT